jgi:superfamily II DNA helicase RecQ
MYLMGILDFEKSSLYDYPTSITEIDNMKGNEFEIFIGNYLKDFEDYDVQYTEKMDHGIDIIAISNGKRYGIQCKRYGPNTKLEETQLTQMQVGVKHYGISLRENTGKPYLIVFTTAAKEQVSQRGRNYIDNNEIIVFYRDKIIDMLKEINSKFNRDSKNNDYENIAYESTKQSKGSYKQNSELVELLKEERKRIAKYNNIDPLYLVYTDKVISEIIEQKPKTLEELKMIRGLSDKNINLFGHYLISKLNTFYKYEIPDLHSEFFDKSESNNDENVDDKRSDGDDTKENVNVEFVDFLKDLRKRISEYNNLKPLYLVFSNDALEEISLQRPTSMEELKQIKGIGEKKCEIFGEYLIKEIKKFLSR